MNEVDIAIAPNCAVCRVCLKSDPDLVKFISLFENYRNASVFQHIMSLAKVTIVKRDGMPDKICPDCLLELETAVNFKEKCEASDQILLLKKSTIEEEFEAKYEPCHKKEESDDDFHNVDASDDQVYDDIKEEEVKPNNDGLYDISSLSYIPLMCPICKRIFKSEVPLQKHVEMCQQNFDEITMPFTIEGEGRKRRFVCSKCNYSTKVLQHFKKHSVRHSGAKPHKCEYCPKAYTQRGNLKLHIETVHKKISSIPCDVCGKDFKSRTHLLTHLKTHSEKRYQCDTCNSFFKSKKILRIHMMRHSDAKTYTCEMCAANFFTLAELSCHRKRHTGIKKEYRFKCLTCNRKFKDKCYLMRHMQRHESGKHFCCEICGRFFDTQQTLDSHKRLHSKAFKCIFCPKLFIKKFSLSRHLENKHGVS